MATIADLKVAFSADTKKLQDGIKNAGKTVQYSGKQIEGAFGAKGTQAIGSTTNAVINFNRVIQDAPYGLIGIANNIDPLVQSFQGLKASTGSAMGAFRLLLKSAFTGPGAMITVVSLATSGLLLLQKRMRGAGAAASESSPQIDGFNDAIKEQIDRIKELQGLKGRDALLESAQLELAELNKVAFQLEELRKQAQKVDITKTVEDASLLERLFINSARALGFSVAESTELKDIENAILANKQRREELEQRIRGLQLGQNVELQKTKETTAEIVGDINKYNEALLKAKSNIRGAGTILRDNLLLEGLGMDEESIMTLEQFADYYSDLSFLTGRLKVELSDAQKVANQFTDSFAEGLAHVIAYGQSLGDMLEGLARQILREGIYKILIALFTGGTGSALTTAGSFGSGLLSGIGGIFGSLGSPVSMGKLPPMMGKTEVYGRFEIKGSDLVTVLSNANTRTLR